MKYSLTIIVSIYPLLGKGQIRRRIGTLKMRDMKQRYQTAELEIARPEKQVKVKITTNKEHEYTRIICLIA